MKLLSLLLFKYKKYFCGPYWYISFKCIPYVKIKTSFTATRSRETCRFRLNAMALILQATIIFAPLREVCLRMSTRIFGGTSSQFSTTTSLHLKIKLTTAKHSNYLHKQKRKSPPRACKSSQKSDGGGGVDGNFQNPDPLTCAPTITVSILASRCLLGATT